MEVNLKIFRYLLVVLGLSVGIGLFWMWRSGGFKEKSIVLGEGKVSVVSEISGVKVSVADGEAIGSFLAQSGFWQGVWEDGDNGYLKRGELKKPVNLVVYITNESYLNNVVMWPGNEKASSTNAIMGGDGIFKLFIGFNGKITGSEAEKIQNWIDFQFTEAIKIRSGDLSGLRNDYINEDGSLFVVTK